MNTTEIYTEVVLVNELDHPVGTMEKMEAHRKGLLHRAFSVFIFNKEGKMLLQQRAMEKYHSAGLWTNACCSHPFPGEETVVAAHRRLFEELGFNTRLKKIFDFRYKTDFDNGLTEFEFDHVFIGRYNGDIHANPDEVHSTAFHSLEEVHRMLIESPGKFTSWFHIAFPLVKKWMQDLKTRGTESVQ
ncbi:MAG: isopentenyl-diphosphate Delta-isomerase [Chitinophagaceae bacterium]